MADVDLYGGDAERIRNQYRQSLGRDASNDDLSGWLSGRYGGGNLDSWLQQIQNSDEAQNYRRQTQTVGQNPNVSRPQVPDQTPPPSQTQQPAVQPGADQVSQWYQEYLGRGAGQDDLRKWLSGEYGWGNAGNMSGIQRGIQASEEAARRRAATPNTSYSNTPYTNFQTSGNDYSAFNTARQQDPGKSAKDAFAMISNQAPPPPFGNRAQLSQWFNTYIRPGMEALGHHVISANEDGFTYSNGEGTFFIDFAQNAGAAPGSMLQRLQWNASPADDATRQRYAGGARPAATTGTGAAAQGGAVRQTPSGSYAGGAAAAMPPFTPLEMPPPDPQRGILFQFDENAQRQIAQWYQQYLGRTPGLEDLMAHAGNPGGLPGIERAIRESPEAREFAARRPTAPTAPPTQPNTTTNTNTTSGGGPQAPGPQFNDPHTQYLEQMLQQMINARMQPVNDPNRQLYEAMLKQRADALGQGNAQLDQLMSYLQTRFNDLQGPGYTGAENEAIRTGALDPIEQDRQAARKRVLERLSARGLTPDSGIAQQALLEIDKEFDAMRGTAQTALTTNDLNRREDRAQRAETISAQLADIPNQRAREQLDVFGALSQLSELARQEDEARQREAVGYGGALADLGPQRLQLAMQAAGMGGNPSSMFGNLMQLAGLNQNAALYGAQNQNSLWSGLGSIVEILSRAGR